VRGAGRSVSSLGVTPHVGLESSLHGTQRNVRAPKFFLSEEAGNGRAELGFVTAGGYDLRHNHSTASSRCIRLPFATGISQRLLISIVWCTVSLYLGFGCAEVGSYSKGVSLSKSCGLQNASQNDGGDDWAAKNASGPTLGRKSDRNQFGVART
jgi:hypothetical protein